jgi:hypothetical protein
MLANPGSLVGFDRYGVVEIEDGDLQRVAASGAFYVATPVYNGVVPVPSEAAGVQTWGVVYVHAGGAVVWTRVAAAGTAVNVACPNYVMPGTNVVCAWNQVCL